MSFNIPLMNSITEFHEKSPYSGEFLENFDWLILDGRMLGWREMCAKGESSARKGGRSEQKRRGGAQKGWGSEQKRRKGAQKKESSAQKKESTEQKRGSFTHKRESETSIVS